MKNQGFKFLIGGLFLFTLFSCGEDVDSYLEPDQAKVVTAIELQKDISADIVVPNSKPIDLTIIQTFNDGSKEEMTSSEIKTYITWEVESDEDLTASKDPNTGKAKVVGEGSGQLKAIISPNSLSGFKQLSSNTLAVKTIPAEVIGIEVLPANDYSVGCELSMSPNTEVLQGCMIQFQAFAIFNNDDRQDITDEATWTSNYTDPPDNTTKNAELLTIINLNNFSTEPWYPSQSGFIEDNQLTTKKGLLLGYSIGNFFLSAKYDKFDITTDTFRVARSDLYSLDAYIVTPEHPTCSNNCQLFENVKNVQIKVFGKLTNGVVLDIISSSSISANPSNNIDILQANEKFTGFLNIGYDAPEQTVFTIERDGISKEISTEIGEEEIVSLLLEKPEIRQEEDLENEMPRKSSSDIYFMLDAVYTNDDFNILNETTRKINLNRIIFDDWSVTDSSQDILKDDVDPQDWDEEKGHPIKTTSATSGSAVLTAKSAILNRELNWSIVIDNESTTPTSLSIKPNNIIQAGVATSFWVMAGFDNLTSRQLTSDELTWNASSDTCYMELVNPIPVNCINSFGAVTTYEPIQITATTKNFPTNITTSVDLEVVDTSLLYITITSGKDEIYGKDSQVFSAVATFDNGRTHVLPAACIQWSLDNPQYGSFSNAAATSGFFTAYDVTSDSVVEVIAKVVDCDTPGRIMEEDKLYSRSLSILPLPTITMSSSGSPFNEGDNLDVTFSSSHNDFERTITIPFAMSGKAVSGEDYEVLSNTGYIQIDPTAPNNNFITIDDKSVIDDSLDENNESLIISLLESGLINARLSDSSADRQLLLEITDNDDEPALELNPSADNPDDPNEGDILRFIFELTNVSGRDVRVDFDITGDVSVDDYKVLDATTDYIVIPEGAKNTVLSIQLLNDGKWEGDESLVIKASADHASGKPQALTGINNIDLLQIESPAATLNYVKGASVQIPIIVNTEDSHSPGDAYLLGNPDWISVKPGPPVMLEIDIPSSTPSSSETFLLCALYQGEEVCKWIILTIE